MHPVLACDGLERGEFLERCLAESFVAAHAMCGASWLAFFINVGSVDSNVLAGVAVLGPGLRSALLACETECVGVGASDAPFVGRIY